MLTTFGINNFRVFGNEGVSLSLKPVTILTGENSSGKSSVIKAMLLMRDYFAAVMNEPTKNPAAVQLDFNTHQLKMSGFESARNKFSDKNSPIIFSYETGSDFAPYPFVVEYAFVKDSDNPTKGELSGITVRFKDNMLLSFENFSGKLKVKEMNLDLLFDLLFVYLKGTEVALSSRQYNEDWKEKGFREINSAVTRRGVDITGWADCFNSCFTLKKQARERIRYTDMVQAIRKSEEFGVRLYFPVFEHLGNLDCKEALDVIKKAELPENEFFTQEDKELFNKCKSTVIDDFASASESSFVQYFQNAEKEFFSRFTSDYVPESILGVSEYFDALFDIVMFNEVAYSNFRADSSGRNSFSRLCTFLHMWQFGSTEAKDDIFLRYRNFVSDNGTEYMLEPYFKSHTHHILISFVHFLPCFVKDLVLPKLFNQLNFFGSSFTPIQRWYSYEEKSLMTDLLKQYKKNSRIIKQNRKPHEDSAREGSSWVSLSLGDVDYEIGSFINKWLKHFGIAKAMMIDEDESGLGFRLYLNKGKGQITALADEGHGITQIVLILIQIEVEIMKNKIRHAGFYPDESVMKEYPTIALEEPEVSLHPNWQSNIALVLEDAAKQGIHFIIETHSEYLIRKTQAIVANYKTREQFTGCPFVVYYIGENGSAYDLEYTESGRFANSFGPGFFDEASRSSVEVLKRERRMRDEA